MPDHPARAASRRLPGACTPPHEEGSFRGHTFHLIRTGVAMDTKRLEEQIQLLVDSEAKSETSSKRGLGRWLLVLIVLSALGYGGYRWWQLSKTGAATTAFADTRDGGGRGGRASGSGRGGGGRASVATVAARRVDMPIYLRGLGTVAASNTVTVRSRVDGQLIHVAFKEGQFVKQGDLLAEIDKRPFEVQLAQAKGQLARDQALLASAKTEQSRNQLLLDKGLIPRQQFDLQIAQIGQYDGAIQADQALIDSANLQITYSKIPAPISGQVGLRLVDEGNIVRAADPGGMVVITQLQPISVLFSIPEDNLGDVLAALRGGRTLHVEAWDHEDTKKIADGVLVTADNQIDSTTGTARLKAVFENADNALYPNQFVNVRLLISVLKGAVTVPGVTIQRGSQGPFVYVVRDNQTAELRPVTIKASEGNDVAIATGLKAGEAVVTEGMDKIQDGARVDVQGAGAPGGSNPDHPDRALRGLPSSRGGEKARGKVQQ
jgi:multidrug efflux system membrane fusion protein